MKRALMYGMLAAILMAVLFISVPITSAYTYDSDIDPKAIEKWNLVGAQPFDKYLLMAYKNPNTTEEILAAIILSRFPGICVAFVYYKNHEAHLFLYDRGARHYVRERDQEWSELVDLMEKLFHIMLGYIGT